MYTLLLMRLRLLLLLLLLIILLLVLLIRIYSRCRSIHGNLIQSELDLFQQTS